MKKLVSVLSILLLLALAVIGCANPGTTTTPGAALGKQFTLSIGQTATIGTEKLDIKFIDITEDSRCASDVTCIWAGQVTAKIEVTRNLVTSTHNLTLGGSSSGIQSVGVYSYEFNVTPYPKSTSQIQKGDYRLQLTVTKNEAALGSKLMLVIGEGAVITGQGLEVVFADVTEDSRCPSDVTCIQAGKVVCKLQVTANNVVNTVELAQVGLSSGASSVKSGDYTYGLNVTPYPKSTQQIQKSDYRLELTVTK